jgi:hypothetical protein
MVMKPSDYGDKDDDILIRSAKGMATVMEPSNLGIFDEFTIGTNKSHILAWMTIISLFV